MLVHKKCLLLITCLCNMLSFVSSFRILCYFPVPFLSHQSVFQILTGELARQGHEVVVLTPLPHDKPIQNLTEIDVHEVSYRLWEEDYAEFSKTHNSFTVHPIDLWVKIVTPIFNKIVDAQIAAPAMQALINDESQHFDVILVEACIPLSIIVSARFKAPVIQVSSFYGTDENFKTIGAQIHPLIFPEYNQQRVFNLSLWDKLSEFYTYLVLRCHEQIIKRDQNNMIRKHFGPNAPTITELKKNVHMFFLNVHHIWDNNRPVPPSVVYLGALHLKKPKPIPNDLQTYLDSSVNGVIYVSLGSKLQFSELPESTVKIFNSVFASLPYDILIKWNGGNYTDKPENVRLRKWLPQNDMLHHPKIKAYIMQGGLQSTDEAIAAKVPMIGLPVYADQWFNAQKFVQHKIGMELDINNLNQDDLQQAILAVAEDKSYRENIGRLSRIMEEQREGGLRKAVYWTEYVAAHGALHLRSPLADISFVEHFMLDVFASLLIIIAISIMAVVTIAKYIRTILRSQVKLKEC